ncbi:rCG58728 [Rattus norvegicus]|uniref:RCG58728 n=1 Tax=Rattus norvegicus TaxID=10116 RepID=A6JLI4_RAT|nr:rCG58728 [Rattus norvegicus]
MLHRRKLISPLGAEGSILSLGWDGWKWMDAGQPVSCEDAALGSVCPSPPAAVRCLRAADWSRVCQCAEPLFTCSCSHYSPLPTYPHTGTKRLRVAYFFFFIFYFLKNLPQAHSKMSSVSV